MNSLKEFESFVGRELRSEGFVKEGGLFIRGHAKSLFDLVEMQKSNYSQLYYLNVGLWLGDLAPETPPRMRSAHMQARAEVLFPPWRQHLNKALDLANRETASVRQETMHGFLHEALLPFFARAEKPSDVVEYLRPELEVMMIRPEARAALGI